MTGHAAYAGAVVVASVLGGAIALWLHRRVTDRPGRLFVLMVALHPVVGALVLGNLLLAGSAAGSLAFALHSVVDGAIPVLFLGFVLAYTNRWQRVPRPALLAVGAWFALLLGLAVTNQVHGLVWTDYVTMTEPFGYVTGVDTALGSALFVPVPLAYFAGMGLLGHRFAFSRSVDRQQTVLLLVGFLPATAVFGTWIAGALPGPLDGGFVIGSTWSMAFVGLAAFRYDLFDLRPLARRVVFEEIDDAVVVVDADYRLLDYNATAAETLPSVAGQTGTEIGLLVPDLIEDGGFVDAFTRYPGGEPRIFSVSVAALERGGTKRGYGLVIRDVTDREQRVRDLEQQTTQLERFASTLSHDIRNPLNVAMGRVELAEETGEIDQLGAAATALERIEAMVEDLLTLSREGRTIDERERVSLRVILQDAWETTETADATLAVDDAADAEVYADPARLQTVFENLVRNAVQHGGEGVTVGLGRHDDGFYLEDDGPGIPAEDREAAFEYEYTTDEEGTGLGLAIVDAIARAHGWTVSIEDGTDGGARVRFDGVELLAADEAEDVSAESGG